MKAKEFHIRPKIGEGFTDDNDLIIVIGKPNGVMLPCFNLSTFIKGDYSLLHWMWEEREMISKEEMLKKYSIYADNINNEIKK